MKAPYLEALPTWAGRSTVAENNHDGGWGTGGEAGGGNEGMGQTWALVRGIGRPRKMRIC